MAGGSDAATEGPPPSGVTSRDIAGVLFRRKGTSGMFLVAAGVAAAAYAFLAPPVFRSEARLLVRVGRESVALDPTATTGRIISVARSRMNEINSELEILGSRGLAGGVVDAIGPGRILRTRSRRGRGAVAASARAREKAVETVLASLDISVVKDSNVIAASFEAPDPELARVVLDKFIARYLDHHISVHRTAGSHSFFVAETEKLRARLERVETALLDIMNESGICRGM